MAVHAMSELIGETIEASHAAVKCLLAHAGPSFECSELVIVLCVWLRQFLILVVAVATVRNCDFSLWDFVFQFTLVQFQVGVRTSRKRAFQPHKF